MEVHLDSKAVKALADTELAVLCTKGDMHKAARRLRNNLIDVHVGKMTQLVPDADRLAVYEIIASAVMRSSVIAKRQYGG